MPEAAHLDVPMQTLKDGDTFSVQMREMLKAKLPFLFNNVMRRSWIFSWAVGQQCFLSGLRGSTVSLVSTVSLLVCGVFVGLFFCFFFGDKPKLESLYSTVAKILLILVSGAQWAICIVLG